MRPSLPRCRPGAGRVTLDTRPFCQGRVTSTCVDEPASMYTSVVLLPPRSAPPAGPRAPARALRPCGRAGLPRSASRASRAASAPSIFAGPRFDRYVATRFLPDANLHGHRPTVCIGAPALWALCCCLGRSARCQVHPSLQPMLTTGCPLVRARRAAEAARPPQTRSRFHARARSSIPHPPAAHRCPERHFGRNQLPDGSFGLSPLCPCPAIELNIRTAQALHRRFRRLRPPQA